MQVFWDRESVQQSKIEQVGIAIGKFDGVHLGHKALIDSLKSLCKLNNLKPAVFTFIEHPSNVIPGKEKVKLLCSNQRKTELFKNMGVEYLFFTHFEPHLFTLSPSDYVKMLKEIFNVKLIVVGFNFTFGYKGAGNTNTLIELGNVYDIKVEILPPVMDEVVISSTRIRKYLEQGDIDKVTNLLGRNYSVDGILEKSEGDFYNFLNSNALMLPSKGVYLAILMQNNLKLKCIVKIQNIRYKRIKMLQIFYDNELDGPCELIFTKNSLALENVLESDLMEILT